MKKFKKLVACVLTAAISAACALPFAGSAATTNVLLGDANGDGVVDIADAACITQYLHGTCAAPQYCFTAMDINQDCVVDETDAYRIQYNVAYNLENDPKTVKKELYTLPDNEKRYYYKYDCSSKKRSSYVLQALEEFSIPDSQIESLQDIAPDERDYENTNVVQLEMPGGGIGSGFIVGKNVIATAAHCVYGSKGFVSDVTVNIYKQDGTTVAQTFKASSYHIPRKYTTENEKKDNYDYALIYVDDIVENGVTKNLTSYAKPLAIGIAAKEFMTTGRDITASGFSSHDTYARYYSTGEVAEIPSSLTNTNPNLRMLVNAETIGGKSGGVMYYTSTYNNVTHKSVVAVVTGGSSTIGTWGVRMNPTLIHFYLQNPNIN
ncbi:MAG: trypsin-like peptidase domain-containing protein [Ruminococcus flavefaciens]|nr:trypsin-like peptidase domain-containing protein [Ruminococcus flavefaciens]MCM1228516.1 trypsin-like peptidase domain-containing protein [Ruminococcus flavefaciens]